MSSDATTDYYQLTQKKGLQQVRPTGNPTEIWGYDGIWPGPTIRVRRGRIAQVRQINNLDVKTTIHNHGAKVSPQSDGHPVDYINPGAHKDYVYPNDQAATTLWYHDHTMDFTGPQVYRGLAGFYIIHDDHEDSLNLPSGEYDVPLVLQDRKFNSDNSLQYSLSRETIRSGFLGDVPCVNGVERPYFKVAQRKYRFRFLNGANARRFTLSLNNGQAFIQIGSDGGLLTSPLSRTSMSLSPAERVDCIVDFSKVPVGSSIILRDSELGDLMRFDVDRTATDTSTIPSTLQSITRYSTSEAVTTRRFVFDRDNDHWTMNGLLYDPARIDVRPKLNTVEIWELENRSGEIHPFHQHLVQFQVLDVDGQTPGPELMGWKDTVAVPSWGSARVIMKFEGFTGLYVFHCHNLEHEDHRMMLQQEVIS